MNFKQIAEAIRENSIENMKKALLQAMLIIIQL